MNKYIEGIAKMIILRSDISRTGAVATKSEYLTGRADEGDYILAQIKQFFPDEVEMAQASLAQTTIPTPTTISG